MSRLPCSLTSFGVVTILRSANACVERDSVASEQFTRERDHLVQGRVEQALAKTPREQITERWCEDFRADQ